MPTTLRRSVSLTAVAGAQLTVLVATAIVIATLCYRTTPWLVLALPVVVGFFVLACLRPVLAVSVTLLLAVTQGIELPLGAAGALSTTEAAFLVLAAGWVWRALTGAPGVRFPEIADFPILALVLALLPGLALGAVPLEVLRLTFMWTAFFLVYLTVRGFSPAELRLVLIALGVGGALLAAVALIGYVQGGGATLYDGGTAVTGRAAFGIADPNYFGGYLLIATAPLAACVLGGPGRWRWVGGAAVGISLAALLVTLSRGAILGAALAAAVIVLAWTRTKVVAAGVLITAGLLTATSVNPLLDSAATEVVTERLSSVGTESSHNKRSLIWAESLEVVRQHPEGVGALQFRRVSESLGLTERGDPLENVHNTYLNLAVELGLAGLLAYLLWCARVAWDLAAEWRRRRPETYPIVVGLAGAFAGYAFQALTIVQYRVQSILATVFVLAGVAAAARAWPGSGPDVDPDRVPAERGLRPVRAAASPGTRSAPAR